MKQERKETVDIQIKILESLSDDQKRPMFALFLSKYSESTGIPAAILSSSFHSLLDIGAFVPIKDSDSRADGFKISEYGKNVLLTNLRNELESILREERKAHFDFKTSKFQYYTFWPVFIFGLIGGGLGIYNFFSEKESDGITKEEMTKQINEVKKENEDAIIKAFDMVYSDSTLINK